MFDLPKSTEFKRRIPKQKFYENMKITSAIRQIFVEQIKTIYWQNKIAATTLNLAEGANVTEIEIFRIQLHQQNLDETVLRQIDKCVPYHILFLLEYEDNYQAWIGYKEGVNSNNTIFKINRYYCTGWMSLEKIPLKLAGLNLDIVYENFVRQIAGEQLQTNTTESIKESVTKDEKRQQLKKQIDSLTNKIRKEKQFNKQVELNVELKKFKKELENLS